MADLSNDTKVFMQRYGKKYLSQNDVAGLFSELQSNSYLFDARTVWSEIFQYFKDKNVDMFAHMTKVPANFLNDPVGKFSELKIAGSVEVIGPNAFSDNQYLKKVTLGDNVEQIGKAAFYKCPMLQKVNLGSSVKIIQAEAFRETGLKMIYLPESVMMIGQQAFPEDCYLVSPHRKRKSLRFPKNELAWYKEHLVLDPQLKAMAQAQPGETEVEAEV